MSDEGGVIPSDVARDAMPQEVTLVAGKGALGSGGHRRGTARDFEPVKLVTAVGGVEPMGKPLPQGVYVSQRLRFCGNGKTQRGKPRSTTGPGKSGRPGWHGGLAETWVMVELGTRRTYRKSA